MGPPRCANCGRVLAGIEEVCAACEKNLTHAFEEAELAKKLRWRSPTGVLGLSFLAGAPLAFVVAVLLLGDAGGGTCEPQSVYCGNVLTFFGVFFW